MQPLPKSKKVLAKATKRNGTVLGWPGKLSEPNVLKSCQMNLAVMKRKRKNKEESSEDEDKESEAGGNMLALFPHFFFMRRVKY